MSGPEVQQKDVRGTRRPRKGQEPSRSNDAGTAAGTSSSLTKITVNLVPRTAVALDSACATTGDSKTDTINRAVQLYQLMTELMADGWAVYLEKETDGLRMRERVHLF
jgi:hypothetical protein